MICTGYLAYIPLVIFQNYLKLRITILKYHSWYLCQISLQIMLLPVQISAIFSALLCKKIWRPKASVGLIINWTNFRQVLSKEKNVCYERLSWVYTRTISIRNRYFFYLLPYPTWFESALIALYEQQNNFRGNLESFN